MAGLQNLSDSDFELCFEMKIGAVTIGKTMGSFGYGRNLYVLITMKKSIAFFFSCTCLILVQLLKNLTFQRMSFKDSHPTPLFL